MHARISEVKGHIANASSDAAAAKASIARAKELGKDNQALVLELNMATTQIDDLTKSLLAATAANSDAEIKLTAADKKMTAMTEAIYKREVKAQAAIARYHRLKLWLCFAGAAAVGLLVFQFRTLFLFLGLYGIAVMAALPLATFAALWFIL